MKKIICLLCIALGWSLSTIAFSSTCLIFVHGKQTDSGTYTSYNTARNYWKKGSKDFIKTATRNFATSYYVVGYNGTRPYFESQTAGEVANEIVRATNGQTDSGGKKCSKTHSQGGEFIVVAHSMGNTIMDYILGNARSNDPNYNKNGWPFSTVGSRISLVYSLSGAHRGSEGADSVCGDGGAICNFLGGFIQDCDDATYWLRSSNDVQVRNNANAPYRTIWLTGGYEAIFGASACLSGEDDGVVQFASIYACGGDPTRSYNKSNVCGNGNKQESSGFKNLDTAHENHSNIRDASDSATRRQIPDGIWKCGGFPCPANTIVDSSMSTAEFISQLY